MSHGNNPSDAKEEIPAIRALLSQASLELAAALGYMRNAEIDLLTGAPKKTALQTLEGGIARATAFVQKLNLAICEIDEMDIK